MNLCDRAQDAELDDWVRRQLEHAKQVPALPAAFYCDDCGGEIPPDRREAQPGCFRCIDCQTTFEHQQKQGNRYARPA